MSRIGNIMFKNCIIFAVIQSDENISRQECKWLLVGMGECVQKAGSC